MGIWAALEAGRQLLNAGERSARAVCKRVVHGLGEAGGISNYEYVELLNTKDLTQINPVKGKIILAVAVRIGTTRLIDNLVLEVGSDVEEALLF